MRLSFLELFYDNLGGNSIYGFHESFNSNYYCRICCTSKEDAQITFKHSDMILRSKSNYIQHLQSKSFGVQNSCLLNELKYFHFFRFTFSGYNARFT